MKTRIVFHGFLLAVFALALWSLEPTRIEIKGDDIEPILTQLPIRSPSMVPFTTCTQSSGTCVTSTTTSGTWVGLAGGPAVASSGLVTYGGGGSYVAIAPSR